MWRKRIVILFVIVVLFLVGCEASSRSVKVVVSLPLGLEIGRDMLNGVQLAYDEVRGGGAGVNGQAGDVAVELVIMDSSETDGNLISPDVEAQNATQAAEDEAVVVYLGAIASSQARAILRTLNEAQLPIFSPSATWPGLTKPGFGVGEPGIYYPTGRRNFFRVTVSDDVQGLAAARWAEQLAMHSVFIVDNETSYGTGIAGLFEVNVLDLGLKVVDHQSFTWGQSAPADLQAVMDDIILRQPDLLFLGAAYSNGGKEFLDVFLAMDIDVTVMVPDSIVNDKIFADLGPERVAGMYGTNIAVPLEHLDSAIAQTFMENYQAAYGKIPPAYAVNCYEAMRVILQAIAHAEQPTRLSVLEAVENLGEISGVLGTWSFTPSGDISLTKTSGFQAHKGVWEFVTVIE